MTETAMRQNLISMVVLAMGLAVSPGAVAGQRPLAANSRIAEDVRKASPRHLVLSAVPVKRGDETAIDAMGRTTGTTTVHGSGTPPAAPAVKPPRTVEKPAGGAAIFFDLRGGQDRRASRIEQTDRAFAQCSPLIGLKVGVARRFENDWEVAGAVGVQTSLVTDGRTVTESAYFADAEVNRYVAGGFYVGTGLSLWDRPRGQAWTPAWLLHFGVPVSRSEEFLVFVVGEGRLFLDRIGDVTDDYQVWAGVRIRFGR